MTKEVEVTVIATPTPQPTPTPVLRPVTNRLVVATFWELSSNDPLLLVGGASPQLFPMHEALIKNEPDGSYGAMLAESWSVTPDAQSWTFNLRMGVQFHRNFGEFTAQDFVHTLKRAEREEVSGLERPLALSVESFDIPYPQTITVNVNAPDLNMEFKLWNRRGLVMQSKVAFDVEGQAGVENNPVGTGPYRFVRREANQYILYEAVPYDHWRITPDFPELQLLVVEEEGTRLAAMLAGEVHMALMAPDLESTAEENGMRIIVSSDVATTLSGLIGGLFHEEIPEGSVRKGEHPDLPFSDIYHPVTEVPWVDVRIREAMNHAINREEINETLLAGRGQPMYITWWHPQARGFDPAWIDEFEEKYGYDPDRARELIAEVEADIGQPLDWSKTILPLVPRQQIPRLDDIAEAVANYMREVGMPIPTESSTFGPTIGHAFNGSVGGQLWVNGFETTTDPTYVEILYYSKNGICCHFFENAEYDAIVEELRPITDLQKRDEIMKRAGRILFDEYSTMPLFWLPTTFVVNPNVVDEYVTSGLLGFGDLETVVAVKQ